MNLELNTTDQPFVFNTDPVTPEVDACPGVTGLLEKFGLLGTNE